MSSREFRDRLTARAARADVALTSAELGHLAAYYQLLIHWNRRINLTALALEPASDHSLDRLFVEPLAAAAYVTHSPLIWFDLGSGGGSPAIPLRIMRPNAQLTLVESRAKKAAFLRELVRELRLTGTTVLNERVEELARTPASTGIAELVTVRALKVEERLFATAHRVLARQGRLFIFGSRSPTPSTDSPFAHRETFRLLPGSGSNLTICTAA